MVASLFKMNFLLSMISKCDLRISWAWRLGSTLAENQEVVIALKLCMKFREGWGDRSEQGSMSKKLDPACLPSTGWLYLRVVHARFSSLQRTCLAFVWGLGLGESDACSLWPKSSLRAHWVPKERRSLAHATGFSFVRWVTCLWWDVFLNCLHGVGGLLS